MVIRLERKILDVKLQKWFVSENLNGGFIYNIFLSTGSSKFKINFKMITEGNESISSTQFNVVQYLTSANLILPPPPQNKKQDN